MNFLQENLERIVKSGMRPWIHALGDGRTWSATIITPNASFQVSAYGPTPSEALYLASRKLAVWADTEAK